MTRELALKTRHGKSFLISLQVREVCEVLVLDYFDLFLELTVAESLKAILKVSIFHLISHLSADISIPNMQIKLHLGLCLHHRCKPQHGTYLFVPQASGQVGHFSQVSPKAPGSVH